MLAILLARGRVTSSAACLQRLVVSATPGGRLEARRGEARGSWNGSICSSCSRVFCSGVRVNRCSAEKERRANPHLSFFHVFPDDAELPAEHEGGQRDEEQAEHEEGEGDQSSQE